MDLNKPKRGEGGCDEPPRSGRHAAGQDPAKRAQILEGATQVFLHVGFDAASMNDITRAAGVSKGTIYVYFENKEDLFCTIVLETRQRIFSDLHSVLQAEAPVEETLCRFAETIIQGLTRQETIRAMRIAIGVAERFPELVRSFFGRSPDQITGPLADFISVQCQLGYLEVDEPRVAAGQFLDLSVGHIWKMRLFGLMDDAPLRDEVEVMARHAVTMFMKAYGTKPLF